jgi:hypothetical protein
LTKPGVLPVKPGPIDGTFGCAFYPWEATIEAVVTLITTASLPLESDPDKPRLGNVFSMPSREPPDRMHTDHRFWDKLATHTNDLDSFFPIHRLQELAAEGAVTLAANCLGVPTEYSQRLTTDEDAPEMLRRCREDNVDAAILVPL